eukprot:3710477-Pyramimonas_sp.AAC.1
MAYYLGSTPVNIAFPRTGILPKSPRPPIPGCACAPKGPSRGTLWGLLRRLGDQGMQHLFGLHEFAILALS